jgi:hypothetical protein
MRTLLFFCLLFGACGYAWLRGKDDERLVAAACVVATFASFGLRSQYTNVEVGVMVVDLMTFVVFTYVALRSERFWPLWISGLQLTTGIGHFLKAMEPGLVPIAYATSLRFWSYPILLILAIATWRAHHRSAAAQERATS